MNAKGTGMTKTKTTGRKLHTPTTADGIYQARRDLIARKLRELSDALNAHEARFEAQGRTSYGYPGDLGRVLELVDETVAAVGGKPAPSAMGERMARALELNARRLGR
jgi:hypothetical protein